MTLLKSLTEIPGPDGELFNLGEDGTELKGQLERWLLLLAIGWPLSFLGFVLSFVRSKI